MTRAHLLLALAIGLPGCAPDDDCDAMCDAALDRYAGCISDAGMEWGESVGYTSEADFLNWCTTWVWEQRALDNAEQCGTNLTILEGGACTDYPALWAAP